MEILTKEIFDEMVLSLSSIKDKNHKSLKMKSLMVSQEGTSYFHEFEGEDSVGNIRSISKLFLGIALGIGLDEGLRLEGDLLSLDTKIWKFFRDKVTVEDERNQRYLDNVTLRHLLTHSIGFNKGLMFSKDVESLREGDFLTYIFNTPITHSAGEEFVYSNVGPYLVSVMFQDYLGVNFSDWAYEKLLSKLEIHDYEWENIGNYCAGSTGLIIDNRDLHKVGELMINGGVYKEKRIVSKWWLDQMTRIYIKTPEKFDIKRALPKYGYGLLTIITTKGIYYGDGKLGQYLIVNPKNKMVISTLANQKDTVPITEAMRHLF